MAQAKIELNKITWLPVRQFVLPQSTTDAIVVTTPHKGDVELENDSLFNKRTLNRVMTELRELENEAEEYLIKEWLNSIKN